MNNKIFTIYNLQFTIFLTLMSLASGEVNMKRKSGPNIEPCEDPTDRALPWILNRAKECCSSNAEAMVSNPAGFS